MKHLIDFIDAWQPRRIAVLGDYMLDHYIYGNAERLSPDAPVPVLAVEREQYMPGGASNVCMDLRALRCEVDCIGVTGDDLTAEQLRKCLGDTGCNVEGLIRLDDRPTTVKRSYVGLAQHRHPQKMFRADFEKRAAVIGEAAKKLLDAVKRSLSTADALCIEDYNKGVCTAELCQQAIAAAKAAGVPVLVDPAAINDYRKYRGCTTITPNRTEAQLATALPVNAPEELNIVAAKLLNELEMEAVVLTLDRHGALLQERAPGSAAPGEPRILPTVARHVYDVSGAGDMVLAMLAAARANGADWTTSVQLANVAAGLEVERPGVVPIPLEDVLFWLLEASNSAMGKVRTVEQLGPELAAYRRQGKKVAFTNGCFDILHAGHIEVLRGARSQADLLVLAVNSDRSISCLKGPSRPIVPEADRVKLLAELECVDYIVVFGDGGGGENDTPGPLVRALKPDVLVKGGDYAKQDIVGWDIVESYGGKVVTIPLVAGLSTSNIVERIRKQKV